MKRLNYLFPRKREKRLRNRENIMYMESLQLISSWLKAQPWQERNWTNIKAITAAWTNYAFVKMKLNVIFMSRVNDSLPWHKFGLTIATILSHTNLGAWCYSWGQRLLSEEMKLKFMKLKLTTSSEYLDGWHVVRLQRRTHILLQSDPLVASASLKKEWDLTGSFVAYCLFLAFNWKKYCRNSSNTSSWYMCKRCLLPMRTCVEGPLPPFSGCAFVGKKF